jgi:RNA polymerase sigma-70 factor (ECF subfamily)
MQLSGREIIYMDKNEQNVENFLLAALRNGDGAELARMVDVYSPKIYAMALRILGDPQDAEDVLQETFLKAIAHLKDFEGRSSLSTWLYRIATNEALMLIRKRKPEVPLSFDDSTGEDDSRDEPVHLLDWCCLPEKELQSSEAREFLARAVGHLSPALRVVFTLRDIQGVSIKDTASILNVSEEAVKTRLLRARLKLREELSSYYSERIAETSKK